jgi:hypothetical protein
LISERGQGPPPDEGAPRTAKSCGPGAATLALSRWSDPAATGARKAASPGRARISRKAIARGKPGCLGCTCSSTRVLSFTTFAHGTAGAVGARLSLRPLSKERDNEIAKLGQIVSRERERMCRAATPSTTVVPAKAGTHTPRRNLFCAMVADSPSTMSAGGYGPRPTPGRHPPPAPVPGLNPLPAAIIPGADSPLVTSH